jgi:hypothetical protein
MGRSFLLLNAICDEAVTVRVGECTKDIIWPFADILNWAASHPHRSKMQA